MRPHLVVLTALAFTATTWAHAAPASRNGLYDNVRVSSVTGDQDGVRIRVNDGPSPTVDFELCEGGCLGLNRFPARIEGDHLSFVYVERFTDVHGRPSGESRARVDGRFVAKGLMLKIDFLDSPHDDNAAFSLIPRVK